MSFQKGRAQVRQGRIAPKGKRARVRESITVAGDKVTLLNRSQKADSRTVKREYVGREFAAQVRENMGVDPAGYIKSVSIGFIRESITVRLADRVSQAFTAGSVLMLRLRLDAQGGNGQARLKLRQQAEKYEFRFESIYGPKAFDNDETGNVEIRLYDADSAEAAVLRAAGWHQSLRDGRWFMLPANKKTHNLAANFCWMHAGDYFALYGVPNKTVEFLRNGTSWSYPLEQFFRALPGSGTTQHMKGTHRYRHKPKARNKLSDGIPGHEARTLGLPKVRLHAQEFRYTSRQYF